MPFGCVAYEASSRALQSPHLPSQSPMPFGCVAYEAASSRPLIRSSTYWSPMPFGCVAYEARLPQRNIPMGINVSNAFRLCGL